MARIFRYLDNAWDDPGDGFTNDDVKKQLAGFFPDLAGAEIQERTLEDGRVEVTFVKKAGIKGSGDFAATDVLHRLDRVKPAMLDAVALMRDLRRQESQEGLDPAAIVDAQPRIQAALELLEAHVTASQKVIERCMHLSPVPSQSTPLGL